MIKNVIDYLEITEKKFGGKKAYCDENREITFSELKDSALKIASGLLDAVSIGTPVLVYMNKSVRPFWVLPIPAAFMCPSICRCPMNGSS